MRNVYIFATLTWCCTQTLFAENLSNLQIVGDEVVVDAPGVSCWITLGIENTGTEERMFSWQAVLQIVPVDDAPSNVFFDDLPSSKDHEPVNYVFSDDSFGIALSDVAPYVTLFSDFVFNSVEVPSSGKNLLQLKLTCPAAFGRYDIYLLPNNEFDTGSFWYDSSGAIHEFGMIPVSDRPDSHVVVSVEFNAIPEPSSIVMLVSGVAAILLLVIACRKHSYCQYS